MQILTNRLIVWLILALASHTALAEAARLRLATTTSTDNSGLLHVLHPVFEQKYNIKVDVISVGTGKALRLAENGDVDVLMVHAPAAEIKFVEAGYGIERLPVMHNDFIIVGPATDPAGLKQANDLDEAMQRLLDGKHGFVSRGDDSGTHKKEMRLWQRVDATPDGDWYMSVGQGMGVVLRIASDKNAYALTDRGTYLAFMDKLELDIVFENDASLFNPYHVIIVNPEKHPHTQTDQAQKYVDFIRGPEGQELIRSFRVNGKVLFHPDVIK